MIKLIIASVLLFICLLRLSLTDIKSMELELFFIIIIAADCLLIPCSLSLRLIGFALPWMFFSFFGIGDILLLAVLGLVFGPEGLLQIFVLSSASAGIFALYLVLVKKVQKSKKIAYAPFISIGVIYVIVLKFLEYQSP